MKVDDVPTPNSSPIDVAANRQMRKWSRREQAGRVLWAFAHPLFALSPRPLWRWRNFLLRLFGAHVEQGARIFPSVRITIPWNLSLGEDCAVGDRAILYALGPIAIGARATVSQGAHLCAGTHDLSRPDRSLLKATILVEEDAWVAADSFIGPNVKVGRGAITGARSVVVKDVEPGWIVAGNPARNLRKL
tara:strand:- start:1204 stop:1773 length:570 start_codon:yes stop_codon:yes gene_type:complete